MIDVHRVAQYREVALLPGQTLRELLPRAAAVFAAPDARRAARTGACGRLERNHVERVGVVRMHDDGEAEVGRQSLADGSPGVAVVVAAQDPDARVVGKAAVVLHVEPAGHVRVTCDLVYALAELNEGIWQEAGAHALVGGRECPASVFANVMAAGGDAQMHTIPFAQDRVHAEPAIAGLPLAGVFVVADARNHLPGIAAVAAPEQSRRLDAAPQIPPVVARLERPNVGERAPVFLGESGSGLRLLEPLPEISRAQDLHAEEGVAARCINSRRATRIDKRGVNRHASAKRAAQREAAAGLRRLGHEQPLFSADAENNAVRHIQPPETAGRMVTTSPGASGVSSPLRSRM